MDSSEAMKKAYAEIDKSQYEVGEHTKKTTDGIKNGWGKAGEAAVKFGDLVKANVWGQVIVDSAKKAASAIKNFVVTAVSAYGEYEQLVGGVETLFGDAAQTVQENAANAFRTAQMSANDYMQTATSFAASLVQSLGRGEQTNLDELEESLSDEYNAAKKSYSAQYTARKNALDQQIAAVKSAYDEEIALISKKDKKSIASAKAARDEEIAALKAAKETELDALKATNEQNLAEMKKSNKAQLAEAERQNMVSTTTAETQKKAAEYADIAMRDMADNYNRMGTDMQSIQNAYQGFAKQNYTMLDNLKLGKKCHTIAEPKPRENGETLAFAA